MRHTHTQRHKERERSFIHWVITQMPIMGVLPGQSLVPRINLILLPRWQLLVSSYALYRDVNQQEARTGSGAGLERRHHEQCVICNAECPPQLHILSIANKAVRDRVCAPEASFLLSESEKFSGLFTKEKLRSSSSTGWKAKLCVCLKTVQLVLAPGLSKASIRFVIGMSFAVPTTDSGPPLVHIPQ